MKKLLVLVLAMVLASSAFAVVDGDADMIGVYFDLTADTYCLPAGMGMFTPMYVILTNSSEPTIDGFQYSLSYEVEGTGFALQPFQTIAGGVPGTNVGTALEPIFGFANPSETTEAFVLVQYYINYTPTDVVYFTLAAHPGALDANGGYDLPAVQANLIMRDAGFSTIDGVHCAIIGGACDVVATEEVSFDSVKSMYR